MVLELEVSAIIVGQIGIIKRFSWYSFGFGCITSPVCRSYKCSIKIPLVYPISGRRWHDNVASTCALCVNRFSRSAKSSLGNSLLWTSLGPNVCPFFRGRMIFIYMKLGVGQVS